MVFGEVVDGIDIVKTMEKLGRDTGKPKAEVRISDCGQIVYQASQLANVKGNKPTDAPVPAALSQPAPEDAAIVSTGGHTHTHTNTHTHTHTHTRTRVRKFMHNAPALFALLYFLAFSFVRLYDSRLAFRFPTTASR